MPVTPPISRDQFEAMLLNPDTPDSALRPYLRLDALEGTGFAPAVVANPELVIAAGREAAVAMASLNGIARWRRQQAYARKVRGWDGLKAVDEGDSWFQYPFLLDDVIDHLSAPWAIYSCSAAGDLLRDMAKQDEIVSAVLSEKPDVLLLSGGGNDVLGGGSLQKHLKPFTPGLAPADYVKEGFDILLADSLAIYSDIIETSLTAGAKRVVVHGYDYAIPNGGRWLGRPMAGIGITDRDLQRQIVRELIDRFAAGLGRMAANFPGKVVAVDTRNSVPPGEWHDELHPTSRGFAYPATLIRASGETGRPARFPGAGPEAPGGPQVVQPPAAAALEAPALPGLGTGDAATVLALLDTDEAALLDEIGRRDALIGVTPEVADGIVLDIAVRGPGAALEGPGALFREAGLRLVARLERELYGLLCGDGADDTATRDALREALGLTQPAVVAVLTTALVGIGCPPFVAPLVATVIVKKGVAPVLEETCQMWSVRLGPPAGPGAPAPVGG